jgi:hypothetical protein
MYWERVGSRRARHARCSRARSCWQLCGVGLGMSALSRMSLATTVVPAGAAEDTRSHE